MELADKLILRLQDTAELCRLCRNESADDIAALLDEAAEALRDRNHDTAVGENWRRDSSLEEWFPMTAEELARLRGNIERLHDALRSIDFAAGQSIGGTATEMEEDLMQIGRKARAALGPNVANEPPP